MQLSQRAPRARRVLAAVACCSLVLASILGMRHEAQVAHVLDPHTGELHEATAFVGHHNGTQSDYHASSDGTSDDGPCAISTALHQASRASSHVVGAALPRLEIPIESARARVAVRVVASLYRLAPKTSPPSCA